MSALKQTNLTELKGIRRDTESGFHTQNIHTDTLHTHKHIHSHIFSLTQTYTHIDIYHSHTLRHIHIHTRTHNEIMKGGKNEKKTREKKMGKKGLYRASETKLIEKWSTEEPQDNTTMSRPGEVIGNGS